MNGMYSRPYAQDSGDRAAGMMADEEAQNTGMMGSLDDIVSQNRAIRRRSVPVHYRGVQDAATEADMRRVSMIDFTGADTGSPLDSFQFDPSAAAMDSLMRSDTSYPRTEPQNQRRQSKPGDLSLNQRYSNHNSPFGAMPQGSAYTSPLNPQGSLDMEMGSPYMQTSMSMPLEMGEQNLGGMISDDLQRINTYGAGHFGSPLVESPMNNDFSAPLNLHSQEARPGSIDVKQRFATPDNSGATTDMASEGARGQNARTMSMNQPNKSTPKLTGNTQQVSSYRQPLSSQVPSNVGQTDQSVTLKSPWPAPPGGIPSAMHGKTNMESQFKNAYSSTGFDMLGVLMRIATRPNPEINIGSVDLSCAFVVCDATQDDNPIVYCSENFERLTGYNKHEVLGRNCRFLQSPDGKVEAGTKRKYVDDDSILYLKNMIALRREAQISIINYRRGGQPFMNLLTMIPIPWDSESIKFFVGFQVDLVEQPSSVTNKNPDGSYTINYQRGLTMPRYVAPDQRSQMDLGQTISRDEVSNALASFSSSNESDFARRIFDKVLLENTDDVVHVLSLKGLFLYLSPSSRKVLEYDAAELVGTALSSVCHPSDIVPVTRELKDTSTNAAVNVVFRIRRKHSGYMWFEGNGALHTEQGKGRKCIILVGRERPVYTLNKMEIGSSGGVGDNELWTKMSTSGMFLFVSTNVRQLLDYQPNELIGTSIQLQMRPESKTDFGRILEVSRAGKKSSVKHEMRNKRGQVLQAFTTLYPGDAIEGQKPTFFVAQTRLLKLSRGGSASVRQAHFGVSEAEGDTPMTQSGLTTPKVGDNSPGSGVSMEQFVTDKGAPMTFSGQNGLAIGHQDQSLAHKDNLFDELKTTRSTSWQFELRQMEKRNRFLAEEVQSLLAAKKKRKRRKGAGQAQKDCANCHTRTTPEWRRGPSGNRDLCNSCGLRWAKQNGRVSPRTSSQHSSEKGSKTSASPHHHQSSGGNGGEASQLPSGHLVSPDRRQTSTEQMSSDNHANHAAKVARMESEGQVPPKIDEVVEPD